MNIRIALLFPLMLVLAAGAGCTKEKDRIWDFVVISGRSAADIDPFENATHARVEVINGLNVDDRSEYQIGIVNGEFEETPVKNVDLPSAYRIQLTLLDQADVVLGSGQSATIERGATYGKEAAIYVAPPRTLSRPFISETVPFYGHHVLNLAGAQQVMFGGFTQPPSDQPSEVYSESLHLIPLFLSLETSAWPDEGRHLFTEHAVGAAVLETFTLVAIFGGHDGAGRYADKVTIVEPYGEVTVFEGPSMPSGAVKVTDAIPLIGSSTSGGLYFFGGERADGELTSQIFALSLTGGGLSEATWSTDVACAGAGVIPFYGGEAGLWKGSLIAGGRSGPEDEHGLVPSCLAVFERDKITALDPSLLPTSDVAIAARGSSVYAMGGREPDGATGWKASSKIFRFYDDCPESDSLCIQVQEQDAGGKLITPRYRTQAQANFTGEILVCGGQNGDSGAGPSVLDDCELLRQKSNEDLDQVVTVSMTSPRVDHRLILMETNGIMITGGVSSLIPADNPEIVETVEIFITNPE